MDPASLTGAPAAAPAPGFPEASEATESKDAPGDVEDDATVWFSPPTGSSGVDDLSGTGYRSPEEGASGGTGDSTPR